MKCTLLACALCTAGVIALWVSGVLGMEGIVWAFAGQLGVVFLLAFVTGARPWLNPPVASDGAELLRVTHAELRTLLEGRWGWLPRIPAEVDAPPEEWLQAKRETMQPQAALLFCFACFLGAVAALTVWAAQRTGG